MINTTIISTVGPDGTLIVNPGTYYQSSKSVVNLDNIIIKAANGHTWADTIINATGTDPFFEYKGTGTFTVDNLTLQNARTADFAGAIYLMKVGSTGYVNSSVIANCTTTGGGGGAITGDTIIVTSSTFTNCSAPNNGGGAIYGYTVTVTSSTITNCSAPNSYGGAISGETTVTVTSSTITGCSALRGGAIAITSSGVRTTLHYSRIYNNRASEISGGDAIYWDGFITPAVTAPDDWWGTNTPDFGKLIAGTSAPTTWLMLGVTATPSSIYPGQTSTVRANLTYNNNHVYLDPASGHLPDGTPVAFSFVGVTGNVRPSAGNMSAGANTTVFSPATTGTATVSATVDGEIISLNIPVLATSLVSIGPITGTPQVGNTLTGGALNPAGATVTYQWNESTTSTGPFVPVAGATGSTYTLQSSDIGKYLEVNVTGTGNYTGSVNSTPVGPVAAAPTPTPTPTSSGGHSRQSTSHSSSGTNDPGYTGPQPTAMGYNPTPVQPAGTPAEVQQPQKVAGSNPVVVQQTVAAPPVASTGPLGGIPVVPAIAALAGIGVIGGGGFFIRRWWIQRQNPTLFKK
jgi:hypothetical protein